MARRDELFARSRVLLLGYYSLLPRLEPSMAESLRRVRALGCRVALDTGGDGGTMDALERALPHLDYYLPSFGEASHQTGERDPEGAISRYRACGAAGVLGVKLGADGVLLSPSPGELVHVPCATPPGPVVDTTGAGDAFYGGFLAGVLGGLGVVEAARLGAATAACCITAHGASAGLRGYEQTKRVALAVG
jgi:sugar/nucleoside kinase (ribokinase family)